MVKPRLIITQYKSDDGDTVVISKVDNSIVVEIEVDSPTINKASSPSTLKSRASVMRKMINEGLDRNVIRELLVNSGYDIKNFASEWFRLNK